MSKDNNKKAKSQVNTSNSNVPTEEFLETYTNNNFWDVHKTHTDKLSNLYSKNKDFERYAERTKLCSEFLTYANRADLQTGELVKKLTNANFCRVRLCPVCQWRRSLMWQSRFYEAIPKIFKKYPDYRFVFLTLTIKNCKVEELGKTLKKMNDSFRKMLKFKRLEGVMQGWLKTTEITRNATTNKAHPHFHLLVMVKPSYFKKNYIKQFEFVEMWQKALKVDYLPTVDIRTVKNKLTGNKDELETAVQELLKYAVKESDLLADPDFLYALTDEIHKKRFISSGGILKDILKEDKENEQDLLNEEELENLANLENEQESIIFKFNRIYKKYTKKYTHTQQEGALVDQQKRIDKARKKAVEQAKNRIVEEKKQARAEAKKALELAEELKQLKEQQKTQKIKQEALITEVKTMEVKEGELIWN